MLSCDDAHRLMGRAADGPLPFELDRHLESCAECRAALEGQRVVARMLNERPPASVHPAFSARVRARIDAERPAGILGLANWSIWGGALAPIGAALALGAWLGVGVGSTTGAAIDADTLAAWSQPAADSEAAVFLQPDASADVLLETLLMGAPAAQSGDSDVR